MGGARQGGAAARVWQHCDTHTRIQRAAGKEGHLGGRFTCVLEGDAREAEPRVADCASLPGDPAICSDVHPRGVLVVVEVENQPLVRAAAGREPRDLSARCKLGRRRRSNKALDEADPRLGHPARAAVAPAVRRPAV